MNFLTISLILDLSSIWYIHANVIGIFVSMTSNFLLNKCWTFEDINFQIKNTLKQYTKFLLFSSVGAAVQLSLIYYLVDINNIDYTSSLILAVLAAGFGNFILNKKFTFNESIFITEIGPIFYQKIRKEKIMLIPSVLTESPIMNEVACSFIL